MARGSLIKPIVRISGALLLAWAAPAVAQDPGPLPPLPQTDPVSSEINQLEQESDALSREARELGGGPTIQDSIDHVNSAFHENEAQADGLQQMAEDMGYTAEELRQEQRRIAASGGFDVRDFAQDQVRDKIAEEAIKRMISEMAGHAFGLLSFAGDCYDVTRRIKLWWITRQQAGSLGDSAQSVHQNFIALNEMIIALYGEMSLEVAKARRLEQIQRRYREVSDRIATLQQGAADSQHPATSHAELRRDRDSGYDQRLNQLSELKFERRIASLQGDDAKVRRLDREIEPLERQVEREEAMPRQVGMAPQSLDRTSSALLAYHNELRGAEESPPLRWSDTLRAHAAQWAQVMAQTGQLQHSPRDSRPANERENISLSPHRSNSPMSMAKLWGNEKKLYHPGVFPDVCAGDWSACAHYTQIIWSTTTEVGCAFAEGSRFDALVCRYSPPGNQDKKPVIVPVVQTITREPCPLLPMSQRRL